MAIVRPVCSVSSSFHASFSFAPGLVDQLEAQLAASRATAEKLLEAVVAELATGTTSTATELTDVSA